MKFRFVVVAAVVAAFACSSVPLVASADFGSFSSVGDYADELSSISPELQSIPGGPQLWTVIQTVRMCLDNPVTTGGAVSFTNSQTIAGYYYHDDDDTTPHLVTVYGFPDNYEYHPSDGRFTVYASDEFTVEALCITSAQNVATRYQLASGWYSFEFVPVGERATWQVYADNYFTPLSYSLDNVTTMTARIAVSSTVILHPADFGLYFSPHVPSAVGGQAFTVTMPDGDLDPDNPWSYIQDSVKPYFQTNYPETEPYLPDDPWQPIYPTGETLLGIPKEWTVENPQIPTSPTVDFVDADADFSMIDPSEVMADNATAFDFWWWLTTNVLDLLDLRAIVVLFVGVGVVDFILWRVGR